MINVRKFNVKFKIFYLSPFLAALYPSLFLLSQNIREYKVSVLILPLLLSLMFASVVFSLFQLIFKNTRIAIPISSLVIFISLSYARMYDVFLKMSPFGEGIVSKGLYVCILVILVLFLCSFLYRYKKHLEKINMIIVVVFTILVIMPCILIAAFEIKEQRLFRQDSFILSSKERMIKERNTQKRDIYYFIFDRYAGDRTLVGEYGFDNHEFENFLEEKSFYIASESASNYPKTFLSLSSSLNMKYLDFLTDEAKGGKSSDESLVTPYIQKNEVVKYLKQHGYSYIHLGSWWQPTATNPNADKNFVVVKGSYWGTDEFTTGFLNSTVFGPILNRVRKNPINVSQDPKNNDHRKRLLFQFDTLTKQVPLLPGPKFVFAHVLAPHDPFVVDDNCRPIPEKVVEGYSRRENYLRQLKCTNSLIEKMVESILKNSKIPPIIILQADEGPFPTKYPLDGPDKWLGADIKTLREKFPILNAYYFPDGDYKNLYPDITPVNTFRIVFNQFFGEKFALLDDRNYIFDDKDNLYKFENVTDIVK